jgi:X-Pro dipeptidyl-peptidase
MKFLNIFLVCFFSISSTSAGIDDVSETVYVESSTDTDGDGKLDRIYTTIKRPRTNKKLSTIFTMSPYSLGGNSTVSHNVDMDSLPQDEEISFSQKILNLDEKQKSLIGRQLSFAKEVKFTSRIQYARVSAHGLGTGHSQGCPTVGDMSEALAAKAVIDWLNGRARAFDNTGREVKADWANGSVGMKGVSYNGTLPIMVAATGVEGLKAIIPIAAISSWYNYYRSNGLVVGPGGYIGEDADELGRYIVRKNACKEELETIAKSMGRESGDYTKFWQDRDYLPFAKNFKAATFIIHGQSDWNVKQRHATELWKAIEGVVPRRIFFHRGGHSSPRSHNTSKKIQAWFDYHLEGEGRIEKDSIVEVELFDGSLMVQNEWPNEKTERQIFYFSPERTLSKEVAIEGQVVITDIGRSKKVKELIKNPTKNDEGRVVFLGPTLEKEVLLSGTPRVDLNLSILNRKAANITIAVVEYSRNGREKIITRGWADPQNYRDLEQGGPLVPGEDYQISFDLEPKQYKVSRGSRIGVVLTSTDYNYTIRPKKGTKIKFNLGKESFITLRTSSEN